MTEPQLKQHLERFRGCGPYLLSVAGANTFTAINLSNRARALQLFRLAKSSGVAQSAQLCYFPKGECEILLCDYAAASEFQTAKYKRGRS
jgi:hypothetical protein